MNKLFNKGLYKEGLKQTKLIGIIFGVIYMLMAIIIPVTTIISLSSWEDAHRSTISNILDMNTTYILSFTLFVPLIALSLFSFMNKRNGSDFYHSIPHKRETIFFSYTLSILTWVIGTMVISLLTNMVISMLGAKYIQLMYGGIFMGLFAISAAIVLVLGAVLLAMSLTGTTFSNIVTALLIIFLPRIIISSFVSGITTKALVANGETFGFIGKGNTNLVFGFMTELFNGGDINEMFRDVSAIIYTLVLGIIYLIVAGIAFKARKSEMAGTSAPNRKIQTAIRVALSFAVCIIACLAIVKTNVLDSASDTIMVIVVYIIALIIYFVYEVITSKSFKGMKKTLPGLLILVVLNILFIGGAIFGGNMILNREIKPEDVSSIYLETSKPMYGNYSAYEDIKLGKIGLESTEVKNQVTEIMSSMQEKIKTDRDTVERNMYTSMLTQNVTFKMKNGKIYHRRMLVNDYDMKGLEAIISSEDGYKDIYRNLPEDPSNIMILSSSSYLNEEDTQKVYESLREEVKEMDFAQWMYSNGKDASGYYLEEVKKSLPELAYGNSKEIYIEVRGELDSKRYSSEYVISIATPKTLKMAIDMSRKDRGEGFEKFMDEFIAGEFTEESNRRIDIYIDYTPNSKNANDATKIFNYSSLNYVNLKEEQEEAYVNLIKQIQKDYKTQIGKEIDITKPMISFAAHEFDSDGYLAEEKEVGYTMNISSETEEYMIKNQEKLYLSGNTTYVTSSGTEYRVG